MTVIQNEMKQLAKSEKFAIYASNVANLVLFAAKVYASVQSRSMAVIASTLDSLLDLLSGFILWFTDYAMKKQNQHQYPIGKQRMQPMVGFFSSSFPTTLKLKLVFHILTCQMKSTLFFVVENEKHNISWGNLR